MAASLLMMATGLTALSASRDAKRSVSARAPNTAAQAIDLARRATAADPNRAEYWQQLALAYVVASRWSDASAAFQHAASLAPYDIRFLTDDIQVQFVLANAGDAQALSRASELAERAVLIDPNNPNGHLNRALIERARQDLSAAATSVARAVALDPNSTNLQLYVTAVEILVAAGKAEDAVRVGQAGVAVFGPTVRSVALRVRLAQALVAAGREPEAVAQLSIALSISPGDAAATRLLGEFPNAGQVTNAAAGVSVTPPVVERGGSITVTWTGIGRPTIGDWVGLFPADNPDTSYVAWHLTTSEPAGSVTIAVPSTASSGEFDVRLFLNYANTRIARSDRLTVR